MVAAAKTTAAAPGLDNKLLDRAMSALLKYHTDSTTSSTGKNDKKKGEQEAKKKEQLLGSDALIQVQFSLAKVPDASRSGPKPIRLDIPHPLHRGVVGDDGEAAADGDSDDWLEEADVCLIVKEESKEWVQEMISTFPTHLKCVKKVLGLQSLRKKHARYQQRRELLARYDVFLCDDRILPMVGKAIGKNFFAAKKQPVPIKLTRKEALPFAVQRCLRATYMHISAGTCITVRAGNTAMPSRHLTQNVQSIVTNAVTKVPKNWANIMSISIKTPDSVALPIYNKTPEELVEIGRLAGIANAATAESAGKDKKRARKEEDAGKEEKKRKKELDAAKSPLVRALKKQKEREAKEKEEAADAEAEAEAEAKALKSEKKKKKKKTVEDNEVDAPVHKSAKKDKKKRAAVNDDDNDNEGVPETPKSAKKKKQTPKKPTATDDDDTNEHPPSFIASKKFKGSKIGYVFTKGRKGLGYYVDVVPVVDRAAMDAFARIAGTPSRGGGKRGGGGGGRSGRTPKSGGRRGGRR